MSKLNELRKESAVLTAGATAKAPTAHTSCSVIARLDAAPETRNGQLILKATPLFDGPYTQTGRPETFAVREARIKECLDNLNKGAGSGSGSILAFGNTWRDSETGALSVGWINTCVSAQKVKGGMNHHQNRRVEQIYAQMPVLDFSNVRRATGEPERIRWALGQDFAEARVQHSGRWQTVSFNRNWLKEKLGEAWDIRQQEGMSINLRLPVLRPEEARAVRDAADAASALEALLSANRYRSVLTRISTGSEVETRWQPLMRGEKADAWAAQLLSKAPGFNDKGEPVADPETGEQLQVDRFSLIEGIDNDVLFDAAAHGELHIEFLPRDLLLVASKNAASLANDIKVILQSQSADDLRTVSFTFGHDPEAVSRVALVFQQQEQRTYVVAGPFRLDTGPDYAPATVPSLHWPPPTDPSAASTPEPEPPLESATVQDIPALGDEDFELDQAAISVALEPTPTASNTPISAPNKPLPSPARPTQTASVTKAPTPKFNARRPPAPTI